LLVRLTKYAANNGMMNAVKAQSSAGPQKDAVKSRKRSGILTAYGLLLMNVIAGMVNAYRSARISGLIL